MASFYIEFIFYPLFCVIYKMYVTLKFDDNGSRRIHSVSDGDKEIVTNER